jgi:hypothetical protein
MANKNKGARGISADDLRSLFEEAMAAHGIRTTSEKDERGAFDEAHAWIEYSKFDGGYRIGVRGGDCYGALFDGMQGYIAIKTLTTVLRTLVAVGNLDAQVPAGVFLEDAEEAAA